MSKPTYEDLVECICGMAVQHGLFRQLVKRDFSGRVEKEGDRFETHACSAYEHAETVLHALGIIDYDGFLIGELPLTEADVRERLLKLPTASGEEEVPDFKKLKLFRLAHDLKNVVLASGKGSMHSWWDILLDVDAFTKGQKTIVTKSADEWIGYCEALLESRNR